MLDTRLYSNMNIEEILDHVFSYKWPSDEKLVDYAIARHGFGGDDGYYGVTYPSDLDEYYTEVEGQYIPDGYVEINYWDGEQKEVQIPESEYLAALKRYLLNSGKKSLADLIIKDKLHK